MQAAALTGDHPALVGPAPGGAAGDRRHDDSSVFVRLGHFGSAAEEELSADQFLELLRQKARLLLQPGSGDQALDLGEAIRRELQAG